MDFLLSVTIQRTFPPFFPPFSTVTIRNTVCNIAKYVRELVLRLYIAVTLRALSIAVVESRPYRGLERFYQLYQLYQPYHTSQ